MAEQELLVIPVQVHAVSQTIFEPLAVGADAFMSPFAVAELVETVLPYLPKIIRINIPLVKIRANRRTA